ncbi:hypothetical protein AMTR_s00118p00046340 [Amborella trichopoda]|uniref:Peptidase S8/S53 domain-containing protein n=1 Tax=Amborella trichopoda TaxID=13333 RepID=W1NNY9_AMBTC|nr:hypothetical protein AMTR_s00118p00046340 [Amborella trichopoda]
MMMGYGARMLCTRTTMFSAILCFLASAFSQSGLASASLLHRSLQNQPRTYIVHKWKGWCVDAGPDFNSSHSNKKLIGAQVFNKGALAAKANVSDSPRDDEGHGTHTATTAGGRFVPGVVLFNSIRGTAAGTAPLAHLAIYKVCYNNMGCYSSDILTGFDKAILDGVDVLSISIGLKMTYNFTGDIIAIGAFEAVQKGILVSCAAENDDLMRVQYGVQHLGS